MCVLFIRVKQASADADLSPLPATAGGVSASGGGAAATAAAHGGVWHLLTNHEFRYLLFVALGLQLAQQFSGINAVFYYSTSFFAQAHFSDPWFGSVLAAFVNVLATAVAVHVMVWSLPQYSIRSLTHSLTHS